MKRHIFDIKIGKLDKAIANLELEKIDLEIRKSDLIRKFQTECKHPKDKIIKSEMIRGIILDYLPIRCCLDCGYAESDWQLGILERPHVASTTRDELLKLVLGSVHGETVRS